MSRARYLAAGLVCGLLVAPAAASPAEQGDDLVTPVRIGRADAPLVISMWAQQEYSQLSVSQSAPTLSSPLVAVLVALLLALFVRLAWLPSIEFPVYAIVIGLLGGAVLGALGIRERLSAAFRTEFFIKTGLVLLGASINLAVIARAAGPAIVQAIVLISTVFLATWWFAGRLGLDDKLRALIAAAVSICGVSAAIARNSYSVFAMAFRPF